VTGAFLVYLSSSQHIFENQYDLKEAFPYIFAGLAISIGLSTFMNGTLVMRFGMRKLSLLALTAFCLIAILYVVLFWGMPNPSIVVLVGFLSLQFFCLGFMWGNYRSIAMEPIGHIAGIGAAINGFISTLLAIPIATFIGEFIADTVWPLFAGLAICGIVSLGIVILTKKPKPVAVTP
ncbi:MAG: Bcr/CflA family drug resistance efflux transporter, partial [Bacteroidota bacterium]